MAPEAFFYELYLAAGLAVLLIAWAIRRSRFGAGLLSIREDEDTARMLGVPTERYKRIAFVISAVLTGVLGVIYAHSLGYITTDSVYRDDTNLNLVVFSLLGGMGTLFGPVIGAFLLVFITQVVLGRLLDFHLFATGLLLVILVLAAPGGVIGLVRNCASGRGGMSAAPILQVDGLSKSFRGLEAITDVSFAIEPGSITSIIGPNGAGKSTLFNLVTGYLRADVPARSGSGPAYHRPGDQPHRRAGHRPRLPDRPPVSRTERAGECADRRAVRQSRSARCGRRDGAGMELAGIAHLADRPASALTVGQLRHLEVARAIATRADLLLADEPCAGLNPTETAAMIEVLRRIRTSGVTVVLVEHDMPSVMEVSDRLLVLDAGRLIADGAPAGWRRIRSVIAAYLGTPDAA